MCHLRARLHAGNRLRCPRLRTLAVAGAVVGEFIASSLGLGYLMIQVQSALDMPAMFMAVVLITTLRVALYLLVLGPEHACITNDARMQ